MTVVSNNAIDSKVLVLLATDPFFTVNQLCGKVVKALGV